MSAARAESESGGGGNDHELAELASALTTAYQRAIQIDTGQLGFDGSVAAGWDAVGLPLSDLVDEVVGYMRALQDQFEDESDVGELFDWDDAFELTPAPGDSLTAISQPLERQLSGQVADTCFTAIHELRQARRRLTAGSSGLQQLMERCEHVRRRLRRSIAAVCDAVARWQGSSSSLADEEAAAIESAVAVRQAYTKFRSSLQPCDEGNPASIRRALRYSAVSIAVLIGSDAFRDVRLADRRLVLSLQTRVFRWVRERGGDSEGVRLYHDIETTADLLRAINLRQELQVHDAALTEVALASVPRTPDQLAHELRPWIARLRPLLGRDDELDALIRRGFAGDESAGLVDAIAALLRRTAASLSGGGGQSAPAPFGLEEDPARGDGPRDGNDNVN